MNAICSRLTRNWKDTQAIGQIVTHGLINRVERGWEEISDLWLPNLGQENPVQLARPVVLVPGWSTQTQIFAPLLNKLEDGNRKPLYVQEGDFFTDPACRNPAQPDAETKVYMVVLKDNRCTPEQAAREFAQAMERLPGSGKVDVLGYSMGGLAARDYLDDGGQRLGKLLMLGTPHHGTPLTGASAHILRREIGWAVALAGLKMTDLAGLQGLAPESAYLKDLNSRVADQLQNLEAAETVAATTMLTLSEQGLPCFHGDGLVPRNSLQLPGVPLRSLEGDPAALHEHQPYSVSAFREMCRFFQWSAGPPFKLAGEPAPLERRPLETERNSAGAASLKVASEESNRAF